MVAENNIFKALVLSVMLYFAFSFTRFAFAQEAVVAPQDTAPAGGAITRETSSEAAGWNLTPLWLLPIIAIPLLLFVAWPKRRHNPMDLSTGYYAGSKGGRAEEGDSLEKNKEGQRG